MLMSREVHMKIITYHNLPPEAMKVRQEVFVAEQGFVDEFDEIDSVATHFVMYDREIPVATCRVFFKERPEVYYLGRLAVLRAYRGKHLGADMVSAAEAYAKSVGGACMLLHAQCTAAGFYEAVGYTQMGEGDEEQGCPHIWMKKTL